MATKSRINFSCRMHVTHLHNFLFFNFDPLYLKKSSRTPIDIYAVFDQFEDAELENDVKTGTGNGYRCHFVEKPNFWVFFLRGTKLKYLSMFQFSTKMANFWHDDSRHVCLQNATKSLFKSSRNSLHNF